MAQIDPRQTDKFCTKCEQVKSVNEFAKCERYKDGYRTHCKSCDLIRTNGWREEHRNSVRDLQSKRRRTQEYRDNLPDRALLARARDRHRRYGIPFDLTLEDIVVPDVCPVLGIPLERGKGKCQLNSPSLDRIIPELGYVKGNVIVVSHLANTIKSNATVEQLCKVVSFYKALTVDNLAACAA